MRPEEEGGQQSLQVQVQMVTVYAKNIHHSFLPPDGNCIRKAPTKTGITYLLVYLPQSRLLIQLYAVTPPPHPSVCNILRASEVLRLLHQRAQSARSQLLDASLCLSSFWSLGASLRSVLGAKLDVAVAV